LAVNKAGTTEGAKVRTALENLPTFQGAVRTYAPAFSAKDREALGPEQVLFVKFERSGALTPQK
jgi:branched-chain amino acid transport system substrate-binding protein